MMSKAREGGEDFDEDLFALACGPHSSVKTYSMCEVNLVRCVTIDREKGKKTQKAESQLVEITIKLIPKFMVSSRKSKSSLITLTRNANGQLFCFPVTGIILNMNVTAGLSCKSMMDASEASTLRVYGTRMIGISCQPRQKRCSMWQTELGEKSGG